MEWCVSMPKVELHAHLNGSVRNSTLFELAKLWVKRVSLCSQILVFGDTPIYIFPFVSDDRSLHEVFKLFDFIHILTTDHSTITRITKEVIEDFASENVVYLELRTTPKMILRFSPPVFPGSTVLQAAASSFSLGKTEVFQLAENAIDFIFADDGVKADLRATFEADVEKLSL